MNDKPKFQKVSGETRFHRLVHREGGISRKEAQRIADAVLQKMRGQYDEWLRADIDSLVKILEALRSIQGNDSALMKEAFNRARAIRDLGTTFGFPAITVVANSFCELLNRFVSNKIYSQDAVDTLMTSLVFVQSSEDTEELSVKLFPGLEMVVNKFPEA